jgi:hypothetical protein
LKPYITPIDEKNDELKQKQLKELAIIKVQNNSKEEKKEKEEEKEEEDEFNKIFQSTNLKESSPFKNKVFIDWNDEAYKKSRKFQGKNKTFILKDLGGQIKFENGKIINNDKEKEKEKETGRRESESKNYKHFFSLEDDEEDSNFRLTF